MHSGQGNCHSFAHAADMDGVYWGWGLWGWMHSAVEGLGVAALTHAAAPSSATRCPIHQREGQSLAGETPEKSLPLLCMGELLSSSSTASQNWASPQHPHRPCNEFKMTCCDNMETPETCCCQPKVLETVLKQHDPFK